MFFKETKETEEWKPVIAQKIAEFNNAVFAHL